MSGNRKISFLTLIVCFAITCIGQDKSKDQNLEIEIDAAKFIAGISKDTIIVVTGSTYAFTVDTPEDAGLVSTRPTISDLLQKIKSKRGAVQNYILTNADGMIKTVGDIKQGDRLIVKSLATKKSRSYYIQVRSLALNGELRLHPTNITVGSPKDLFIFFTAGQRSPNTTVRVFIPAGIQCTPENTTVNVIGRGDVLLRNLARQSIGRAGMKYSYRQVGSYTIRRNPDGSSVLIFTNLDLRPSNGADIVISIRDLTINKAGKYLFRTNYTTSQPEEFTSAGINGEMAFVTAKPTVTDFARVVDTVQTFNKAALDFSRVNLKWTPPGHASSVQILQSLDSGKTWSHSYANINVNGSAIVAGLQPDLHYSFRLTVSTGKSKGYSNPVHFYSGMMDIRKFGVSGSDGIDNTTAINTAIAAMHEIGGGIIRFTAGTYSVRTVHLKSNVWLYVEKGATIKALKGADAPETTWFSDKKYRSGLSPTDTGPYADPENYLTKQDVGHHYFHNTMFFGERLDNVKIIGNGYITGNGNLVTGDRVMNNPVDNRADKMFTFKLCKNIEIGGIDEAKELWYDSSRDEPYYINRNGSKDFEANNMLHIDRGGHFVLLATGTDNINVHDTYFAKLHSSNARDIYDFMGCNNVRAMNIFSRLSSDDIVKPGSDCSLGFTRPATNFRFRNIIGDTNCNLFQIGSETADDITDVHVDNIYVLGANKAGFSISTNDGATIRDIHLNCGHTGPLHVRSKMYRTFAPFFISISNRGRILGAEVAKYAFTDNGEKHSELLVTNVNIGLVENIILNGIDVYEVYAGSSHGGQRWKPFDGSQRRATAIVAGYSLPNATTVVGGLNFKLPNGKHTGYVTNIEFNDVHILAKGGNPLSDTSQMPPELGVGQYNVSNLKVQPSYGIWARHVSRLKIVGCSFNYEKPDYRYALFLDDVQGASISSVKMMRGKENDYLIKFRNSSAVKIENAVYYNEAWKNQPSRLPGFYQKEMVEVAGYPAKEVR